MEAIHNAGPIYIGWHMSSLGTYRGNRIRNQKRTKQNGGSLNIAASRKFDIEFPITVITNNLRNIHQFGGKTVHADFESARCRKS